MPTTHLLLEAGGVNLPITGEEVCGDGWAFHCNPLNTVAWCMVVDGLGHGELAYEASQEAIRIFNIYKENNLTPEIFMQKIHVALNKSRGAALAMAKIDLAQGRMDYIGIGNIAGVILTPLKRQSLISMPGIIGHAMRKLNSFSYVFPPHASLIMHSDGLISHWDTHLYPGLMHKPACLIASVLYRDYKRGRDDVTVIAIKNKTSIAVENSQII